MILNQEERGGKIKKMARETMKKRKRNDTLSDQTLNWKKNMNSKDPIH